MKIFAGCKKKLENSIVFFDAIGKLNKTSEKNKLEVGISQKLKESTAENVLELAKGSINFEEKSRQRTVTCTVREVHCSAS